MTTTFWQDRLKPILKQGLTPEQLALTVAVGLGLGTIPVLGVTSLACAAAAAYLRLNQAAIQAVNYTVYPLQLALLLPFLRLGSLLFGGGRLRLTPEDLTAITQSGFTNAVATLGVATLGAIAVWALLVIPGCAALYWTLRLILKRAEARRHPLEV